MAFSDRLQRRAVLLLAAASLACAPAPRMGEAVDIAEEGAIIIWDAAAKTQHFIRRAAFRTEAKDFGFLVPTPSVPELKDADDAAFDLLERVTAPPAAKSARAEAPKAAAKAEAPKVEVIAKVKVAGFDAAILKANDAGALDGWLTANGYHSSPELIEWYKPYVARSWILTAFKIDAGAKSGRHVEGTAVRMSFQTDQPFFPYREPATGKSDAAPRLLQIYFLGDSRAEGRIGGSDPWPGRTIWSGVIPDGHKKTLLALLKLPETTAVTATRLTRFSDGSSPRPGRDDLYFSAAADQSVVPDPKAMRELVDALVAARQKQERDQWLTLVVVVLLVLGGIFFFARRGSRKK